MHLAVALLEVRVRFVSSNRPREVLPVDGNRGHGLFSAWVRQFPAPTNRGCEEDWGEEERDYFFFSQYQGAYGPDWRSFQERDRGMHPW